MIANSADFINDTHQLVAPRFLDLFAGCGGFSLGLSSAGLQGLLAIERDPMAFESFRDNFLSSRDIPVRKFDWPSWLEKRAWPIDEFLSKHRSDIEKLKGTVDVMAGGPPCQGFSFAGRRQADDPRNMLFHRYVEMVEEIEPRIIVLENVPGMRVAHTKGSGDETNQSYYDKLAFRLRAAGYKVDGKILDASRFGVPQRRSRLIVIGVREDVAENLEGGVERVFHLIDVARLEQLRQLDLSEAVCAEDAISDLRTDKSPKIECIDPLSPRGFQEVNYRGPITGYQKLMQIGFTGSMDSMRLARHTEEVRARFKRIQEECDRGVTINKELRLRLGIKKHRTHPMSPDEPAPTITTLPDDVLHYAEPRILTVRESARLQSFPDWFRFRGKFTTGGALRTKECPRYTQVGNAVPPLLARAIGLAVLTAIGEAEVRAQLRDTASRIAA